MRLSKLRVVNAKPPAAGTRTLTGKIELLFLIVGGVAVSFILSAFFILDYAATGYPVEYNPETQEYQYRESLMSAIPNRVAEVPDEILEIQELYSIDPLEYKYRAFSKEQLQVEYELLRDNLAFVQRDIMLKAIQESRASKDKLPTAEWVINYADKNGSYSLALNKLEYPELYQLTQERNWLSQKVKSWPQ